MKRLGFILWVMCLPVTSWAAIDCKEETYKNHPACEPVYFPMNKQNNRLRTRIKLSFDVEERDAFSFEVEQKQIIKRGSLSFEWVF